MLRMIFPPKCVLCRCLLSKEETDLCHNCREKTDVFTRSKRKIPFVAHWTALWYYKDDVSKSIKRFKFYGHQRYANAYGRLLAMKLGEAPFGDADIISWVPVSGLRKLRRGFDQSQLLAIAVAREMGTKALPVLKKIRHTPPQSRLSSASFRRANVSGAYKVVNLQRIAGKKILLLDDVVTTGATLLSASLSISSVPGVTISLATLGVAVLE